MGKLRYDPKHHLYPHHHSKTQKIINKTLKKPVKVTYISSPLLVRACDASEFRSVVQQLTGRDSNDLINKSLRKDSILSNLEQPTRVMKGEGGDGDPRATTVTEEGNGSSCYYNGLIDSLEFDEDYFWKEVARSVWQSPSFVLA